MYISPEMKPYYIINLYIIKHFNNVIRLCLYVTYFY